MIILNDYKILTGERGTLINKNHFSTKIQENIDGHTLIWGNISLNKLVEKVYKFITCAYKI